MRDSLSAVRRLYAADIYYLTPRLLAGIFDLDAPQAYVLQERLTRQESELRIAVRCLRIAVPVQQRVCSGICFGPAEGRTARDWKALAFQKWQTCRGVDGVV